MYEHRLRGRRREQGVVLLTLLLLLLSAGSYVLLRALNVAASATDDGAQTRAALIEAKRAVINYSIYKAELNLGPGRLPCPDLTGDGMAAGSCVLAGANETTGRFPYVTVDSTRLTDSSGTELWYAVADSHRNFLTTPINSDTGGTSDDLSVDSTNAIVAIIFAPGSVVSTQDRSSGSDITDYLEGANASLGDANFATTGVGDFNDDMIVITREELMVEVENRVLSEVQNALKKYYDEYTGFPRPSPFADPSVSTFEESVVDTEGHLAVHRNGASFNAPFSLSWNIPSDGALSGTAGPQDACMRSSTCDDDDTDIAIDFSLSPPTFAGGSCTWTSAEVFNCTGTITRTAAAAAVLERTYTIVLTLPDQNIAITPPTGIDVRRRNFNLNGRMPPLSTGSIQITDVLDGVQRGTPRTLNFTDNDTVNIALDDVPFFLGDDAETVSVQSNSPAALPRWFTDNNWHHFIYYSTAAADAPGGGGCTAATDCLTLRSYTTDLVTPDRISDDVKGLVVIAGADVGTARPSANLVDYFENDNLSSGDDQYSQYPVNSAQNDQVKILNP